MRFLFHEIRVPCSGLQAGLDVISQSMETVPEELVPVVQGMQSAVRMMREVLDNGGQPPSLGRGALRMKLKPMQHIRNEVNGHNLAEMPHQPHEPLCCVMHMPPPWFSKHCYCPISSGCGESGHGYDKRQAA